MNPSSTDARVDLLTLLGVDADPVRRMDRLQHYDELGRNVFSTLLNVEPLHVADLRSSS